MDGTQRTNSSPTPPKRSRLKELAKRIALLLVTVILLLAGAEIAARLLTDPSTRLTERDPVVGQRNLRSFSGEVFNAEAGRRVPVRFNSVGFRGPEWSVEKPPGVRRIAILGDSMVAALGVDEDSTMAQQLEAMLNREHPAIRWEVLNFGVSGASPGQELVLYREVVARYNPDVVVEAFFVGNDLADNSRELSNNPRIYFDLDDAGNLHQLPLSGGRAALSQFLNRYSRFYVWQRTALNRARCRLSAQLGALDPGQWIFCKAQQPPEVARAWILSDKIFQTMREEVEKHGSRLAVVVIPSGPQVYNDAFEDVRRQAGEMAAHFDPDYPDQRLAELCRHAGVPCCTMTADFRAAAGGDSSESDQQWLFFCEGIGHFSDRGNAVAARSVYRFLTDSGPQQSTQRPIVGPLR